MGEETEKDEFVVPPKVWFGMLMHFITMTLSHAPQVQIGQSPVYTVDKRLGKGGFGQVYLGKRLARRSSTRDTKPQTVAIKFEHVSSKGCHNGSPPEWAVYKCVDVCLRRRVVLFHSLCRQQCTGRHIWRAQALLQGPGGQLLRHGTP